MTSERTSRSTSFTGGVARWGVDYPQMKCTTYGTPSCWSVQTENPPFPFRNSFHLSTSLTLSLLLPPIHTLMPDDVRRLATREALLEEVCPTLPSILPLSFVPSYNCTLLIPPSRRSFISSIRATLSIWFSLTHYRCLGHSLCLSVRLSHSLCFSESPYRGIYPTAIKALPIWNYLFK